MYPPPAGRIEVAALLDLLRIGDREQLGAGEFHVFVALRAARGDLVAQQHVDVGRAEHHRGERKDRQGDEHLEEREGPMNFRF